MNTNLRCLFLSGFVDQKQLKQFVNMMVHGLSLLYLMGLPVYQ